MRPIQTSRAERRECARLRNPGLITFREARFGDLQIQIADYEWLAVMLSALVAVCRSSGSGRL